MRLVGTHMTALVLVLCGCSGERVVFESSEERLCGGADVGGALVVVQNAADLEDLAGHKFIPGGLAICGSEDVTDLLPLASLELIHGSLVLYDNRNLRSTEGLERLTRVDGTIILTDNAPMDSADFPALVEAGPIRCDSSPAGQLRFPALRTTDFFEVLNCGGLGELHMGHPEQLQMLNLLLRAERSVTELAGTAELTEVDELTISGTNIETLSFPELDSVGLLTIHDNPRLREIDFPKLQTIAQGSSIDENPLLPACAVKALQARFDRPWRHSQAGNDNLASCP